MDYRAYKNKKFVLQKIAKIIKHNPKIIVSALERSDVYVENENSKKEIAEKTAYALANTRTFPSIIGNELAKQEALTAYSNLGGKGKVDWKGQTVGSGVTIGKATAAGAKSGGIVGAIIGAVVGVVDAGFGWAKAGKNAKIEEEQYRQELLNDLFTKKEKKNKYLPIFIIGGVLIAGGVVTYFALKEE